MSAAGDVPLEDMTLHRVRMPLVHEHVAAHGAESIREVILVEARAEDGMVGWGECPTLSSPTYTEEYTSGAWHVLGEHLIPAVLAGHHAEVAGHLAAGWAITTALDDIRAYRAGESLAARWAGLAGSRSRVASTAVIAAQPAIDSLLAGVEAALELGHRSVKVKISPSSDVEALRAIRSAWPDLDLAADANGSLPAGDTRRFDAIEAIGLMYLEQPLAPDDLVGSGALTARMRTPIVLDEAVRSAGDVATIAALGAADGVNAKPGRLGRHAIAVARAARAAGLEVVCGGMLETGVGRAAALAVAALPEYTLPADLGPSVSYFAAELVAPFVLDEAGTLAVPDGPGLGVVPDPDRLAEVTVDRRVLCP